MKTITFLLLTLSLGLLGCGQCTVGSACKGITQTEVDKAINNKDTSFAQKKADCTVLGYHQTVDYGSGCLIEWK